MLRAAYGGVLRRVASLCAASARRAFTNGAAVTLCAAGYGVAMWRRGSGGVAGRRRRAAAALLGHAGGARRVYVRGGGVALAVAAAAASRMVRARYDYGVCTLHAIMRLRQRLCYVDGRHVTSSTFRTQTVSSRLYMYTVQYSTRANATQPRHDAMRPDDPDGLCKRGHT